MLKVARWDKQWKRLLRRQGKDAQEKTPEEAQAERAGRYGQLLLQCFRNWDKTKMVNEQPSVKYIISDEWYDDIYINFPVGVTPGFNDKQLEAIENALRGRKVSFKKSERGPYLRVYKRKLDTRYDYEPYILTKEQKETLKLVIGESAMGPHIIDLFGPMSQLISVGMPGSGKSEFSLSVVAHIATNWEPDEVDIYILDATDAEPDMKRIKHVKRYAVEPRDCLAGLKEILDEINRRTEILRSSGYYEEGEEEIETINKSVKEYNAYAEKAGKEKIRPLFCIFDEIISTRDQLSKDKDNNELAEMDRLQKLIATKGRKYFVHCLNMSQRITADDLARAVKVMSNVIAFKVEDRGTAEHAQPDNVRNIMSITTETPGRCYVSHDGHYLEVQGYYASPYFRKEVLRKYYDKDYTRKQIIAPDEFEEGPSFKKPNKRGSTTKAVSNSNNVTATKKDDYDLSEWQAEREVQRKTITGNLTDAEKKRQRKKKAKNK